MDEWGRPRISPLAPAMIFVQYELSLEFTTLTKPTTPHLRLMADQARVLFKRAERSEEEITTTEFVLARGGLPAYVEEPFRASGSGDRHRPVDYLETPRGFRAAAGRQAALSRRPLL